MQGLDPAIHKTAKPLLPVHTQNALNPQFTTNTYTQVKTPHSTQFLDPLVHKVPSTKKTPGLFRIQNTQTWTKLLSRPRHTQHNKPWPSIETPLYIKYPDLAKYRDPAVHKIPRPGQVSRPRCRQNTQTWPSIETPLYTKYPHLDKINIETLLYTKYPDLPCTKSLDSANACKLPCPKCRLDQADSEELK